MYYYSYPVIKTPVYKISFFESLELASHSQPRKYFADISKMAALGP